MQNNYDPSMTNVDPLNDFNNIFKKYFIKNVYLWMRGNIDRELASRQKGFYYTFLPMKVRLG